MTRWWKPPTRSRREKRREKRRVPAPRGGVRRPTMAEIFCAALFSGAFRSLARRALASALWLTVRGADIEPITAESVSDCHSGRLHSSACTCLDVRPGFSSLMASMACESSSMCVGVRWRGGP